MPKKTLVMLTGLAIIASSAPSRAQTSTLPDVVGIRPGISAQEAYNLLKARAPRAKIGIGQFAVAGVTDKPVPVSMSMNNSEADPPETIQIWLTLPPSKQVVCAIGRTLQYEEGKQVLRSTVVAGLRQKYGQETDGRQQQPYWEFDEQGRPTQIGMQNGENCMGRVGYSLNVAAPAAATYASFSPLLYTPGPRTVCDSLIDIRAMLEGPRMPEYVLNITVLLSNRALAWRTQDAYQTYLANADSAKKKEELEKAKQQKAPAF